MAELPRDWKRDGACAGTSPSLFYPEDGVGQGQVEYAEARAVCSGCPVRELCLQYALANGENDGMWGGHAPRPRRRMRRGRVQLHADLFWRLYDVWQRHQRSHAC